MSDQGPDASLTIDRTGETGLHCPGIPGSREGERPTAYADRVGEWCVGQTSDRQRKARGIFLTPVQAADFMGGRIVATGRKIRILDPSAGAGPGCGSRPAEHLRAFHGGRRRTASGGRELGFHHSAQFCVRALLPALPDRILRHDPAKMDPCVRLPTRRISPGRCATGECHPLRHPARSLAQGQCSRNPHDNIQPRGRGHRRCGESIADSPYNDDSWREGCG